MYSFPILFFAANIFYPFQWARQGLKILLYSQWQTSRIFTPCETRAIFYL
jgi:hypothetical protein